MFETLFKTHKKINQHLEAPLVQYRLRYLRDQADAGLGVGTLRRIASCQLRLLYLIDLREGERVDLARIEAAARVWYCPRLSGGWPVLTRTRKHFVYYSIRWLRYLGWFEEPEEGRRPFLLGGHTRHPIIRKTGTLYETIFKEPRTINLHLEAPLFEYRLRYLQHLAETGMSRYKLCAIAAYQLRLLYLADLREGERVELARIEAAARVWSCPWLSGHWPVSSEVKERFVAHSVRWLRYLGWFAESKKERHPYTAEVAAYEQWMRVERGLSEETIRTSLFCIDEFLAWLTENEVPLATLGITDIDRAIAAKNARKNYSRITIKNFAGDIRAFIRFAEGRGLCRRGMAQLIIPPRIYPTETVPAGLAWDDIQRLLATTEGGRPTDKRDRAILMLLIAYGLRSGEVRGMRLDDIDWENETLHVRRAKSGRTDVYPLSHGVGQAILRYICDVRPACSERTLFLTLRAPIQKLSTAGLGTVVRSRLRSLGVVARRTGPHAVRHGVAQHLLDQGMTMKVIGDFLGHREPSSTAIYARVDLRALREVADFSLEGLV